MGLFCPLARPSAEGAISDAISIFISIIIIINNSWARARHCDLARFVGRAGGRMDRREERDPQFGTIFPPQRHQARCLRRRRRRCPFPFQLPRNTPLPSLSVYLSMDKRFPLDQEQEDKRSALEGRGPRFPNPACLSLCPPPARKGDGDDAAATAAVSDRESLGNNRRRTKQENRL